MATELEAAAAQIFRELMRRTHLSRPDDLADVVAEVADQALGASDVVLYVVNHEQTALVPVAGRRTAPSASLRMDGTMGGHAFTASTVLDTADDTPGRRRLWLPMLDGTDRMGVLALTVAAPDGGVGAGVVELVERFAHAVAQAILSKQQYGDVFELHRRSQPMALGAELLHSVLPPATFATDGLVIATMLEPAYVNGGDAFDYAVNGTRAHLAVFDGMGHGLAAAGISTFAVAAYRHSRRAGLGLTETYAAMDAGIGAAFPGRFATAVLAELDLETGVLRWVSAGHPAPFLIRRGRVVRSLTVEPATPLGLPSSSPDVTVGQEHLESGDSLLLYTDGLTEARQPGGGFLTEERLAGFVQRQAAAMLPTPETLRRLRLAILEHQGGRLDDDATAVLVDWRRGTEEHLLPQTVE